MHQEMDLKQRRMSKHWHMEFLGHYLEQNKQNLNRCRIQQKTHCVNKISNITVNLIKKCSHKKKKCNV